MKNLLLVVLVMGCSFISCGEKNVKSTIIYKEMKGRKMSITKPLLSGRAYINTISVNSKEDLLHKSNRSYLNKLLSMKIAKSSGLGALVMFTYGEIGIDTLKLEVKGKKYPLVYSPVEYQCTDLTFVKGNYFKSVRVLLGHWAKNRHNAVKRKQIAEAVANTIEIAKRNGVDLKKVIKDKIDAIVKDSFSGMREFKYWPPKSKTAIKNTMYSFCINPTHTTFMKLAGIKALWSKYLVYNSSFTASSGNFSKSLGSINPSLATEVNIVSGGGLRTPIYAYLGFKSVYKYNQFVKNIVVPAVGGPEPTFTKK